MFIMTTRTARTIALSALAMSACAGVGASTASAGAPIYSGVSVTPYLASYAHDAPTAGYGSQGECELSVSAIESDVLATPINAMTTTFSDSASCWKQPSGRWTYGSLGFNTKGGVPSKIGSYRKVTTAEGLKMHGSANYPSQAACESTRQSVIDAIYKNGGKMLNANPCIFIAKPKTGSPYYTYGALTYSSSSYKVVPNDAAPKSIYMQTEPTLVGVA